MSSLGIPSEIIPDMSNSESMFSILKSSQNKINSQWRNFYTDGEELYKNVYDIIKMYNQPSNSQPFQLITNP